MSELSCDYSPAEWEEKKALIHQLYIEQNRDFKSMTATLAAGYNFHPTKNKFLNMLKQWGFRKNTKAEKWKQLSLELKRKGANLNEIKHLEIDGLMVTSKKLKKEIARHNRHSASSEATYETRTSHVALGLPTSSGHHDLSISNAIAPGAATLTASQFSRPNFLPTPHMVSHPLPAPPFRHPFPYEVFHAPISWNNPTLAADKLARPSATANEPVPNSVSSVDTPRTPPLNSNGTEVPEPTDVPTPTNYSSPDSDEEDNGPPPDFAISTDMAGLNAPKESRPRTLQSNSSELSCQLWRFETSPTGFLVDLMLLLFPTVKTDILSAITKTTTVEMSKSDVSKQTYRYIRVKLLDIAATARPDSHRSGRTSTKIVYNATKVVYDRICDMTLRDHPPDARDVFWCIEGLLPEFQSITHTESDLHLQLVDTEYTDCMTVCFYVCYLRINKLIESGIFDELLPWVIEHTKIANIVLRFYQLTNPMATFLRTEFLHAAIRTRNRELVVGLFDARLPQLSSIELEDLDGTTERFLGSALQAAIVSEDVELAQMLLGTGAKSHIPADNILLRSALSLAVRNVSTRSLVGRLLMLDEDASSKDPSTVFHIVRSGLEQEMILALISRGGHLRRRFLHESTTHSAVHAAAIRGCTLVLETVLDLGFNADGFLKEDVYLRHLNSQYNHSSQTAAGPTPLMRAIEHENVDAACMLLDRGADPYRAWKTQSPISLAVGKKLHTVLEKLLQCDVSILLSGFEDLSIVAIKQDDIQTLDLLLQTICTQTPRVSIIDWDKLMSAAARNGKVDSMRWVIDKWSIGREVDVLDEITCDNALITAAEHNQVNIMRLLDEIVHVREGGSHASLIDLVLSFALKGKAYDAVWFALQNGCHRLAQLNLSIAERRRNMMVSLAAASGRLATLRSLLNSQASPDGDSTVNLRLGHPLASAIINDNMETLKLLLNHSANDAAYEISCGDNDMRSWLPAEIAVMHNKAEALEILRSHNRLQVRSHMLLEFWTTCDSVPEVDPRIVEFVLKEAERHKTLNTLNSRPLLAWSFAQGVNADAIARVLLNYGAHVNPSCMPWEKPLYSALSYRRFAFAAELVAKGAHVNTMSMFGARRPTALEAACSQCHVDSVKLLLKNGACVIGSAISSGATEALKIASGEGLFCIVEILLDAGTTIQTPSEFADDTAIATAALNGRVSVLSTLLERYKGEMSLAEVIGQAMRCAQRHDQQIVVDYLELLLNKLKETESPV